jgi:hypothetical protein
MNDDEAVALLAALKRLSEFSASLLSAENIRLETLFTRKAYVYSQFIFSLSLMDGIITLAQQGQARSMVPLVRALWEGWLGVAFVYSGNTHVWTYYLQLQEEMKNKKKRDDLYAGGKIEDEARYKERNKEAAKIINAVNRRYKELPLVPKVITKERSLTRDISLRQKCQIIDYYDSLRPKHSPSATTLVGWYDSVYSHLSGTAHVSVTELNNLYKYDASGGIHVDISGGEDRKYLSSLLLIAYLYHYLLMKVFIGNISTSKKRIPDDIKTARRHMTAKKFRQME